MHQTSNQPEFTKTIKEIRDAEEEYDRLINSAKEKADKIMREAKEKTLAEHQKCEEDTVTYKNDRLKAGSKDIEGEVAKIVDKAKGEGAKLSKEKLEEQMVSKLVKDFLSSL